MPRAKELTKNVTFRLTPEQYAILEAYSRRKGGNLSIFLRALIIGTLEELQRCGEV